MLSPWWKIESQKKFSLTSFSDVNVYTKCSIFNWIVFLCILLSVSDINNKSCKTFYWTKEEIRRRINWTEINWQCQPQQNCRSRERKLIENCLMSSSSETMLNDIIDVHLHPKMTPSHSLPPTPKNDPEVIINLSS